MSRTEVCSLRPRWERHMPGSCEGSFCRFLSQGSQYGGLPARNTDGDAPYQDHHAQGEAREAGALFMDVKNAFPSFAHVMVFGEQNFERPIAKVDCLVQELPEQYRERERDFILEWLDGGSALQRLGVPAQLAARLEDWHTQSFVAVEGDSRVASCVKGTRPGDPLADIIFNVAMHAALDMFLNGQTRTFHTSTTPLPLSLTTVRGGSCRRWIPRWLRCVRPWHDSACIST